MPRENRSRVAQAGFEPRAQYKSIIFTHVVQILKYPSIVFYLLYPSNRYSIIYWKKAHRLKNQRVSYFLVVLLTGVHLGELLDFILSKNKNSIKLDFYESVT